MVVSISNGQVTATMTWGMAVLIGDALVSVNGSTEQVPFRKLADMNRAARMDYVANLKRDATAIRELAEIAEALYGAAEDLRVSEEEADPSTLRGANKAAGKEVVR